MSSEMAVVNFGTSSEQQAKFDAEREVSDRLAFIRDNLPEEFANELAVIMEKVKEAAIELCPKDTGALASSISLEGGTISSSYNGDFFEASISAGNEQIVNPKTGKPTSEYAQLVHDGHTMRDGAFYEGVPFLDEAMAMFEGELEACVERALKEMTD